MMDQWRRRPIACLIGVLAALYTVTHFAVAGVRTPLASLNIKQVATESAPLSQFMADGRPVVLQDLDQYGPVFFFVMQPILHLAGGDLWRLAHLLYASQLVSYAIAFLLTALMMAQWLRERPGMIGVPLMVAGLAFVWANFSPALTIIATKGVETWELALISASCYAYLRGWRAASAACIAAGAMIKIIPGAYLVYFLVRDRRAFWHGSVAMVILLALSHAIYGPAMGAGYVSRIVTAGAGTDKRTAFGMQSNVSIKSTYAKLLGHLPDPDASSPLTSRGYFVELEPRAAAIASALGAVTEVILLAVMVGVLWMTRSPDDRTGGILWDWGFVSAMMLLMSPVLTFDYLMLALPAVSVAAVGVAAHRSLRTRGTVITFGCAVLLIAVIVPRDVINRLLLVDWMLQWTGHTHLMLSEGYQYFGWPLAGLACLCGAMVLMARACTLGGMASRRTGPSSIPSS